MTILVQGAMEEETDVLIEFFKPTEVKKAAGYEFLISHYKDCKIVISKTDIGTINASVATTVGISEFAPDLVINQGCAGGHLPHLKIGDLVIGDKAVYINDFKTPPRALGEGSDSLRWIPGKRSYVTNATPYYVKLAESVPFDGRKYVGTVGSGDLLSKEVDRINFLHATFGELCEDMESAAAFRVCDRFGTDRIALRIISNNEINDGRFVYEVCHTLQKFVISFIDELIRAGESGARR